MSIFELQTIINNQVLQVQDEILLQKVLDLLNIKILDKKTSQAVEDGIRVIEESKQNGTRKILTLKETLTFLKS